QRRTLRERVREWQRALVALGHAALDAAVETGEDDVDRVRGRPRLLEERGEGHAPPAPGADGLLQPRLTDDVRLDESAPVARALHRHQRLDGIALAPLIERERQPPPDATTAPQ